MKASLKSWSFIIYALQGDLKLLKGDMQGATFQKVHPECHEVGLEGTLNSISLEESVL